MILVRPLTCHTVWYNRNACVPLTLERWSVNVLTCEFAHRIQGCGSLRRVAWGEKEGGDEEPDRPGRPTQREQHSKLENNPPTRNTTHEASNQGATPANTRPNLSSQREQQPRPQVKNNPTGTQPARQTTHQTSPPHQKRTATHKTATSRQPPPPNRGTARTKTHSPPSGWGRELRRGLRGTAPAHHTTRQPRTGTHQTNTSTHQTPQPQNPTPTRNPTAEPEPPPPSYHPTTHTPPGTLHTCHGPHPTDVNACQQTGTKPGNKFSQKQNTNAPASTQPPPHHPPVGRQQRGGAGGTTRHATCAQQTSTTSTLATTTN